MDEGATAAESPGSSAVQGVPWWGSVGQPQYIQPAHSNPVTSSLFLETQTTIPVTSFLPPVLQQATVQEPEAEGNDKEQSQPCASGLLPPAVATRYMLPSTQLEVGCSLGLASYPYTNAYLTGMVAAYGAQAMIQPHMLGIQQSRMALPSDIIEEEPVYVNAKQYHGILRRRQSRAKADSENKLMKSRKPYLHESRHRHALRRARGCGGRFLNTKLEETNVTRSSSKQMSQEEIDLKRRQPGASENNSFQTLNDSTPVSLMP